VIDIDFPMPVRRVLANDKLLDDKGRVALERGPIVFCAEGIDNKDGDVLNLVLRDNVPLRTEFRPGLLNGVQVIHARAIPTRRTLDGKVVTGQEQDFTAIPFYAWAHRGLAQMNVWPARVEASARPSPAPTIAFTSKVSVSGTRRADAINDQFEPQSSNDHSIPFFHWWPRKGTREWVQYDFKKPETVSSVEIYWFDDTGIGECRVPESWRVLYRDGDQWKPVTGTSAYGVERDQFNRTTFSPVKTGGLRLEIQLKPEYSTGLFEWKVE
jgi:hypothetical protein